MNKILIELEAWGCDVKSALARTCNDEEFYIECLNDIISDSYFEILKNALESGDIKAAFNAAHTLKGVLSNVGLTPMFDKVVEIVEPLRSGENKDLSDKFTQLLEMKKHLEDVLNS